MVPGVLRALRVIASGVPSGRRLRSARRPSRRAACPQRTPDGRAQLHPPLETRPHPRAARAAWPPAQRALHSAMRENPRRVARASPSANRWRRRARRRSAVSAVGSWQRCGPFPALCARRSRAVASRAQPAHETIDAPRATATELDGRVAGGGEAHGGRASGRAEECTGVLMAGGRAGGSFDRPCDEQHGPRPPAREHCAAAARGLSGYSSRAQRAPSLDQLRNRCACGRIGFGVPAARRAGGRERREGDGRGDWAGRCLPCNMHELRGNLRGGGCSLSAQTRSCICTATPAVVQPSLSGPPLRTSVGGPHTRGSRTGRVLWVRRAVQCGDVAWLGARGQCGQCGQCGSHGLHRLRARSRRSRVASH